MRPFVLRRRRLGVFLAPKVVRFWWAARARYGARTATLLVRFLRDLRGAQRLFARTTPSAVVVHTDYTTHSLALALAAERARVKIHLFQSSEMNMTRPRHRATVAYAYAPGLFAGCADKVVSLAVEDKPLKPVPERPVIGVALNNYVDDARVAAVLERLKSLPHSDIIVRYHPNSPRASGEPLEVFLDRCDVLVAGNTGTQAQAVRSGVPVVHCGELDDHPFDSYGLVADGKVYGVRRSADISLQDVASFYCAKQPELGDV